MAVPDRYYGPLFDKIGDSRFWARAKRVIRGVSRRSFRRRKNRFSAQLHQPPAARLSSRLSSLEMVQWTISPAFGRPLITPLAPSLILREATVVLCQSDVIFRVATAPFPRRAMTRIFCPSRRHLLDVLAAALILGLASKARAQGVSTLKIATIGAGAEGGALGTIFAKLGHPVMFSSRHPEQLKDLVAAAGPNARAGSVADAVAFGDIIFLVVPYSAVEQIGREYGKTLATKPLVVDVSNPSAARDGDALAKWVDEQGGAGLATAKLLPGAHIVRAFNNFGHNGLHGAEVLVKPTLTQTVGVPIAGDDPKAIALAINLFK